MRRWHCRLLVAFSSSPRSWCSSSSTCIILLLLGVLLLANNTNETYLLPPTSSSLLPASSTYFDVLVIRTLPDGELETRIRYRGMVAKETSATRALADSSSSITLRELCTTGSSHLIQLIYTPSGELLDCEFGRQTQLAKKFLNQFQSDLDSLSNNPTATATIVKSLEGETLPMEFTWMNYTQLRSMCRRRHREMRKEMEQVNLSRSQSDRSRRDVSDLLRIPGTQWCGKGYSADKYTRLGGFSRTDKCCRKHDLSCPFWIGGFETKYGLFNWRVNTLMHCHCDERFRACLKRVGTSDANLVGNLFFNVVQTKCFVLKPRKKCVRSSWWGKCEKHKIVKQAILRDNLPY